MSRLVRPSLKTGSILSKKPAEVEVAPHRYRFDEADDDYRYAPYKEFLAGVPYKEGEVIMVHRFGDTAAKAVILEIGIERDRFGDRREKYRIAVETKAGEWSKLWEWTHPGFVQRGYLHAGLAPDCEGKL